MIHLSELLFLAGFIIFIAAILILDMLVIDRKAHVVSIKEAGTWTAVWIGLALLFAIFLWFHGDMVHGSQNIPDVEQYRHNMTISYISGYLIEKTLSVDNLFVMMMIFTSFGVGKNEYQHVLNWGILGAIVLRFIFIFAGAAIISRFDWILLVFGAFLVYSGIKMFVNRNKKEEINVEKHPLVKFLSKTGRMHPQFEGDKFFVRKLDTEDSSNGNKKGKKKGKWLLTPLFVTVLVIEFSDLIFAFDSIPAVFSVSLDPYVVFFSNIFAILGLRAMFFLLAAIADKFRYLKTGVCVLLVFIGVKMLIHEYFEIDAIASLIFIIAVLVISIGASLLVPKTVKKN